MDEPQIVACPCCGTHMYEVELDRSVLASSPSQTAGWVLVPVEPTMLMYDAWVDAQKNGHDDGVFGTWIAAYKAMCAAAPALGEGER